MNSCTSYIISFNLHFQTIQKYSCDSEVALTTECSFSFIYIAMYSASKSKLMQKSSWVFQKITSIQLNMKSKLKQILTTWFYFPFFPFLLNLCPITKSINQMLHILPFLFSKLVVLFNCQSCTVYLKFSEAEALVMKNILLLEIPSKGRDVRKFRLIIIFSSSYRF